jgi:hypothetical protein
MHCESNPEASPTSWRERLLPYWVLLLFILIMGICLFGAALLQQVLE